MHITCIRIELTPIYTCHYQRQDTSELSIIVKTDESPYRYEYRQNLRNDDLTSKFDFVIQRGVEALREAMKTPGKRELNLGGRMSDTFSRFGHPG